MAEIPGDVLAHFDTACDGFAARLAAVRAGQWELPTPCPAWTVRLLVNHMARGNLNYAELARGGSGEDFLRQRDLDALGTDPVEAFARSVRTCRAEFARPGGLARTIDYPFGRITAGQALAIRVTDSVVHTWDLARALGLDEELDPTLVRWIDEHVREIYAGLPEMPVSATTTHRVFAPARTPAADAETQERVLNLMGRATR